jgi:hypothetical protein
LTEGPFSDPQLPLSDSLGAAGTATAPGGAPITVTTTPAAVTVK